MDDLDLPLAERAPAEPRAGGERDPFLAALGEQVRSLRARRGRTCSMLREARLAALSTPRPAFPRRASRSQSS